MGVDDATDAGELVVEGVEDDAHGGVPLATERGEALERAVRILASTHALVLLGVGGEPRVKIAVEGILDVEGRLHGLEFVRGLDNVDVQGRTWVTPRVVVVTGDALGDLNLRVPRRRARHDVRVRL